MHGDLMKAVEAIRENAGGYTLASDYYHGEVDEFFASPAVKRALRGAIHGFDVNLARRPVDVVLDRVEVTALSTPDGDAARQALIELIWDPNRMDRYAKIVHRASLIYGDAYLIVWPGAEDGTVDMFYNSPVSTRVFYSPENPRVKSFAAKLWTEGSGDKELTRVDLYYPDRIEKYATKPGVVGEQESEFFELVADSSEVWPMPNPFGVVPVFHFRTDEPYGRPEHVGAFGPQNAITKLSATLMATIDFQGFPQRYALMEATDQLVDWDDDDESRGPGYDSDVTASRPRDSGLRGGPGELWKLPGTTKVGQFDPANVEAFTGPLGVYTRLMASATATPLRFFDPQGAIPSGAALRADEAPLASRIRDREAFWSEEWASTLLFAASVIGLPLTSLDIQWEPVQVLESLEDWRTIELKMKLGVPYKQAMIEAGYSSELIDKWEADRQAVAEPVVVVPEASAVEEGEVA